MMVCPYHSPLTTRYSPVATRYLLPFSPTKHPPPQKQPCDEGRSSKRRSQPNWQPFLFGGDAVKVDAQKAKEKGRDAEDEGQKVQALFQLLALAHLQKLVHLPNLIPHLLIKPLQLENFLPTLIDPMVMFPLHRLRKITSCRELQKGISDALKGLNAFSFVATKPMFGNLLRKAHQGEPLVQGQEKEQKVFPAQMDGKFTAEKVCSLER